jgi:hypothetical protein
VSCAQWGRDGGHFLGCAETWKVAQVGNVTISTNADVCEHGDCLAPKKPWSGKGAKPKFCAAGHKKEKS